MTGRTATAAAPPASGRRMRVAAGVAAGALGLLSYYCGIELFLGIHIHLASLFVILVMLEWGMAPAVAAAAIASLYPAVAWHFPGVTVLAAGEALFLGFFLKKSRNVVLLDTIWWIALGIPLSLLFHSAFLHSDIELNLVLSLKNALGGILNALLATILFQLFQSIPRRRRMEYDIRLHQVLITWILAAIVIPAVAFIVMETRRSIAMYEATTREAVTVAAADATELLSSWLEHRIEDVESLAERCGDPRVVPPERIRATAEFVRQISHSFVSMSVQNDDAVSVAFVPTQEGERSAGRDYSKMPYHRLVRERMRPIVSDVDFGTVLKKPRVAIFAPIAPGGRYAGYCTGVLDLTLLNRELEMIARHKGIHITLMDTRRQVIASTDPTLSAMQEAGGRFGGESNSRDGIYEIISGTPRNNLERWQNRSLMHRNIISSDIPWSVVVEAPTQEMSVRAYGDAARGFALLLVLVLFSLAAAQAASATIITPIASLAEISAHLPATLVRQRSTQWPQTQVHEVVSLMANMQGMKQQLDHYVDELQKLNESLEVMVEERTEELRRSEERFRRVFVDGGIGIVVADVDGNILDCNPKLCTILGYNREELAGRNIAELTHPDDLARTAEALARSEAAGGQVATLEKRYLRKDGCVVWGNLTISCIGAAGTSPAYRIGLIEDITERKKSDEEIWRLAYSDGLTGLPNRTLFLDRITQFVRAASRSGSVFGVFFLDLDRFKDVNDTLGHGAGDQLLVAVARRLETVVRRSDTVARLGGDEFVVILSGCRDAEGAGKVADMIIDAVKEPFLLDGVEISTSTSIGIALYPQDGTDVETLQKHADLALYRAKAEGRNMFCFFTPEMNREVTRRRTLQEKLQQAAAADGFTLAYQPLIELRSGSIYGVEALLRWDDGEAEVPPAHFIPVAEEMGLIHRIGEWVLRQALLQLKQWVADGIPSLQVSVNLSPRQLKKGDFLQRVEGVLQETGIHPSSLELEVTETTLVDADAETLDVLRKLNGLGIRIAIDDFGTGFSSLSYLREFPVDRIKIDRSFIREVTKLRDDVAIIEAVVAMGQRMGIRVLAEGVEEQDQLELLSVLGCDEVQGFLLGKPMSPQEIEALLRAQMQPAPVAS